MAENKTAVEAEEKAEKAKEKVEKAKEKAEKVTEKVEKAKEKAEKAAEKAEKAAEKAEKATEKVEKVKEKAEKATKKVVKAEKAAEKAEEEIEEEVEEAEEEIEEEAEEAEEKPAKPKAKKKKKKTTSSLKEENPELYAKVHGNATGYRVGAVVAWIFAIAFEILAILIYYGRIELTFMSSLAQIIILLVLDLGCVITGSLLWKKANRIDPASEKNKVKFWLWNNMGLIVCAFAFIPFVILALSNKKADKKTKTIATIVAIIALLIGGLISYEWNPVSEWGKADAITALEGEEVYWTYYGRVFHTNEDCGHINNSDSVEKGDVKTAIESNKVRICKDCAKKDEIELDENGNIKKAIDVENEIENEIEDEIEDEIDENVENGDFIKMD